MREQISIEERKRATEEETREFIEEQMNIYRDFVLTLNDGIEYIGDTSRYKLGF